MTEQTQPTDAGILDAADDFRSQYKHGGTTFDEFDALGFARAVLAKWGTPAGVGEVVAWQSRCRPTWGNNHPWTPWELCTKGQAEDYQKTPLLHDWEYEARALYTTPQPTQAQAGFKSGAKSFQTYAEANAYSKGYYAGKKAATKAQAGAVPLTEQQMDAIWEECKFDNGDEWSIHWTSAVRAAERLHGIKGADHA